MHSFLDTLWNAGVAIAAWSATPHGTIVSVWLLISLCTLIFKPKTADEYARIAKFSPRLAALLQVMGSLGIDPVKLAGALLKLFAGTAVPEALMTRVIDLTPPPSSGGKSADDATTTTTELLGGKSSSDAGSERAAIVARMREIVEVEDPTQPWHNKSEKARFLLGVSTIIEQEGRPVLQQHRWAYAALCAAALWLGVPTLLVSTTACSSLSPQDVKTIQTVTKTTKTAVDDACILANAIFPSGKIAEICHLAQPIVDRVLASQRAAGVTARPRLFPVTCEETDAGAIVCEKPYVAPSSDGGLQDASSK